MELLGLGNKILGQVDRNSSLIGSGFALIEKWPMLSDSVSRLISGNVHAPNVAFMLGQLRTDPSYQSTVMAIIGGYLAQQSGVHLVDKIGKIAVKIGTGYLVVRLADLVLASSTHSPGSGKPLFDSSAGFAPAVTAHGYGY